MRSSIKLMDFYFLLLLSLSSIFAYPLSKDYQNGDSPLVPVSVAVSVPNEQSIEDETSNIKEPTCDELRTMWRFSKRQSRAAELTNSIPTYRDPLVYNEWDVYPRLRYPSARPVYYGKMMFSPQQMPQRDSYDRTRAFGEATKYFGTPLYSPSINSKQSTKNLFRLGVGGSRDMPTTSQSTGSFQHIKDLIKKERAKELQEQRKKEEARARAAAIRKMLGKAPYPDMSSKEQSAITDNSPSNYFTQDRDDSPNNGIYGLVKNSARKSSLTDSKPVPNYYNDW